MDNGSPTSPGPKEGGHIWKTRADGSGSPQQLTRVPAYYRDPAWSPDGQRIVALRAPRIAHVEEFDEFGHLGAMDLIWLPADGGDANFILPARGGQHPHFGPENGSRLRLFRCRPNLDALRRHRPPHHRESRRQSVVPAAAGERRRQSRRGRPPQP